MTLGIVETRPARWHDIRFIGRLYLGADDVGRRFYHPLPRTAGRLWVGLVILVGAGYLTRWLGPRSGVGRFVLMVAVDRETQRVLGFASVRLRRSRDGAWVARTGVFVEARCRRQGIGRILKVGVLQMARSLGAVRAEAFLHPENHGSVALNRSLGLEIRAVRPSDDPPADVGPLIAEGPLDMSLPPLGPSAPPTPSGTPYSG